MLSPCDQRTTVTRDRQSGRCHACPRLLRCKSYVDEVNVVAIGILAVVTSLGVGAGGTDDVRWNKGSGPQQMSKGIPNPPGWYRAAVGPRTHDKVLYLTFDDGPAPATSSLLRALRRHDATATFFVSGQAAAADKSTIRRMHRDGHAIGNHTWDHPRLTQISTRKVHWQLRHPERLIRLDSCMRPPYGLINERVAKVALGLGFQPVMWTAHIDDWSPHSQRWTVRALRMATSPGAVILMHDTHATTVSAVRTMLPKWQKMGYRFAVVPACEPG